MIDATIRAGQARDLAAGLSALDVPTPGPIVLAASLLAAAEEVTYPAPDIGAAVHTAESAKDITKAITDYATWVAQSTAFGTAKSEAAEAASRRLVRTVAAHRDQIVAALAEPFAAAAETFTAALAELPGDIAAEALIAAGGPAVVAYGHAVDAAAVLTRIRDLRRDLAQLTGEPTTPRAALLQVARITDPHQLDHLAAEFHRLRTAGALEPWRTTCAGADLSLATPGQVAALDREARQAAEDAHKARLAANPATAAHNARATRMADAWDRRAS